METAGREDPMLSIKLPLDEATAAGLQLGQRVCLNGELYTARDAAHRRMMDSLARGERLPIPLDGEAIYYCGPCPAPPGWAVGSAGPTTSSRLDPYLEPLLARGLKATVGKGPRSPGAMAALARYRAVYFVATGGAGALMATRVLSSRLVAYEELGPEAIYCMKVHDFPVLVAGDARGNDLFAV